MSSTLTSSVSLDEPLARLMVMAGGTGGHVFPALAVANTLRNKGTEIIWLGTHRGIEATVVPENNLAIEWVTIDGLRGKGLMSWLTAPVKLLRAILQCVHIIRRVQPDCVLGMGGFVSGPGGLAARILGKPLVVHEQNAVAGLTNKVLSKIANRTLTGFPNVDGLADSAEWVGNPVRDDIRPATAIDGHQPINILVLGGSQGSHSFNQHLASVFIQQQASINIWHQTGKGRSEQVAQRYTDIGGNARVTEFIEDMAAAYEWANLLICRAGAMTIAESCAAAKPSLLIPYPFSAGDHQVKNAQALVEIGAAKMLSDKDLAKPIMISTLAELLADRQGLSTMGERAHSLHKPLALTSVVTVCEEYLHA